MKTILTILCALLLNCSLPAEDATALLSKVDDLERAITDAKEITFNIIPNDIDYYTPMTVDRIGRLARGSFVLKGEVARCNVALDDLVLILRTRTKPVTNEVVDVRVEMIVVTRDTNEPPRKVYFERFQNGGMISGEVFELPSDRLRRWLERFYSKCTRF